MLRVRVADFPSQIEGLARELGRPLTSAHNVLDGRAPVGGARAKLEAHLESPGLISALYQPLVKTRFGDLLSHGSASENPGRRAANAIQSVVCIDRLRLFGDLACDDTDEPQLDGVLEDLLGALTKKQRFSFRSRWNEADKEQRERMRLEELPSCTYLLETARGPMLFILATAVLETVCSKIRARKFWRIAELRTREGVTPAVLGARAYGKQRCRGDYFIEVTGAACCMGLLDSILKSSPLRTLNRPRFASTRSMLPWT